MTERNTEIELKFFVPSAGRSALMAEISRGTATLEKTSLAARYLDTDDRRLALAGIAWRLRREGRRWIQTLKAAGPSPLTRFEHEVIRPDATCDGAAHVGTPAGDQLAEILRRATADGIGFGVRFETNIRRTARRVRTRGAIVEVAFDEGQIVSGESTLHVSELEFELVSGSPAAMLLLAERWRKRFGLIYEPRSKAERGDQLADAQPFPPVRKARLPEYRKAASASEAFGIVIDECLAQVTHNAIGLCLGDPTLRVEHVHQMRVGIRRLRCALRSFRGWVPPAPVGLVEDMRALFTTLGTCRDSDVMDSGVLAELARVGAPPLVVNGTAACPNPEDVVKLDGTQRLFLAWLAWRESLACGAQEGARPVMVGASKEPKTPAIADDAPTNAPANPGRSGSPAIDVDLGATLAPSHDASGFHFNVERRLRRWHGLIAADWKTFDEFDEERMHGLRKRIKRQRYAAEFFAPVLRRRWFDDYLKALSAIQDRMGEVNDLFVARSRFHALVASNPTAWFALGWLAARIVEARALAKPELRTLAKARLPTR